MRGNDRSAWVRFVLEQYFSASSWEADQIRPRRQQFGIRRWVPMDPTLLNHRSHVIDCRSRCKQHVNIWVKLTEDIPIVASSQAHSVGPESSHRNSTAPVSINGLWRCLSLPTRVPD